REVERAVSAAIRIIPFRIEDAVPTDAMEYYLGSHHWLDAMTPPLQQHLERLAMTIKTLVAPDLATSPYTEKPRTVNPAPTRSESPEPESIRPAAASSRASVPPRRPRRRRLPEPGS